MYVPNKINDDIGQFRYVIAFTIALSAYIHILCVKYSLLYLRSNVRYYKRARAFQIGKSDTFTYSLLICRFPHRRT